MTPYVIPVGTSEPQDFALRNDGVAFDGSGFTIGLSIFALTDGAYVELDTPPTVAWLNQAGGTVRVTGVDDLDVGNYFVRFSVTADTQVGFFPNGDKADVWRVVAIANR